MTNCHFFSDPHLHPGSTQPFDPLAGEIGSSTPGLIDMHDNMQGFFFFFLLNLNFSYTYNFSAMIIEVSQLPIKTN